LSQDKTAIDQQHDVKQLLHYGSLKTSAPDMHSRINSAEFAAIQDTLGVQFTLDAYCKDSGSNRLG